MEGIRRQERAILWTLAYAYNWRDLNPAIIHDGLVIVAPDDTSSIFAFDAGSGRLVWKSESLQGDVKLAHLLGVAKGRLVATGDRVLLFDVKTGKLVHSWPDSGRSGRWRAAWPPHALPWRQAPRWRSSTESYSHLLPSA